MSLWSAIGLADRKTVDELLIELQKLRNENHILMTENQNLMIEKINRECENILQAEAENTNIVKSFISEICQSLSKQLENEFERNVQQINAEGASVLKAIVDTGEQTKGQLAEISDDQKALTASVADMFNELNKTVISQKSSLQNQVADSSNQILKQQETELCGIRAIEKSHQEWTLQMENICSAALEEIKLTTEKYQDMELNEKENLNKIKKLSDQFAELETHQKAVMERLFQLCQDSDQFMEIQKSINDIWEIMKVVWVDSLLNEYRKEI